MIKTYCQKERLKLPAYSIFDDGKIFYCKIKILLNESVILLLFHITISVLKM